MLPVAAMSCVKHRVQDDLNAGRLWKARDRLLGARRIDPANQWVLNSLGEIYFKMGDLPAAGGVWFLSSSPKKDDSGNHATAQGTHQDGTLCAIASSVLDLP